jgi:hypothetical protein
MPPNKCTHTYELLNKMNQDKNGGDSIRGRHIQRQSRAKATTPRNGVTKLTPTAAMTFESGMADTPNEKS